MDQQGRGASKGLCICCLYLFRSFRSPGPIFISQRGSKAEDRDGAGIGKGGSSSWWSYLTLGLARVWQSAQADELVFVKV